MITRMDIKQTVFSLLLHQRFECAFAMLYSTLIYALYELHEISFLASINLPVGLAGMVLSVFLAFRNNNAYGRWWEARILWGDLVNSSRMFGAQVLSMITPPENSNLPEEAIFQMKKELILRHLAFINLMRMQLREDVNLHLIKAYISERDLERIEDAGNPAVKLNMIQSESLRDAMKQGWISDFRFVAMLDTLERFYNIIGACERIKNTPFPREYDGFIRLCIWLVILVLPLYLLNLFTDDVTKLLVIPISVCATLILGFANKAGVCLEEPFDNRIHDVPMTSLCNLIERDLRQQMQETDVPVLVKEASNVVW